MNEIKTQDLDEKLFEFVTSKLNEKENVDLKGLDSYISAQISDKAVLGFDIYRYSQYPTTKQFLIPHLFKKLYDLTITNCIGLEPNIFKDKKKTDFTNLFIDTGDGGFQIFENPLEAIVFAMFFQANIARYNSKNQINSAIYEVISEINLRYSLTYDKLYFYNKNFYGPAIINCARIMAKDKLNRFLIDNNSIVWFNEKINGIENLQRINKKDFENIDLDYTFDKKLNSRIILLGNNGEENQEKHSVIFDKEPNVILKTDLLRIGEIKSKLDTLSIYSLHMQYALTSDGKSLKKYTVSLGNLNSSGLNE